MLAPFSFVVDAGMCGMDETRWSKKRDEKNGRMNTSTEKINGVCAPQQFAPEA